MAAIIERLRERPLLRRLRERIVLRIPFLQKIGITPETLTPAQKELMQRFRRGIAEALGVKPEHIREEPLTRWIIQWSKAWTVPEIWVGSRAQLGYDLGYNLGKILKEAQSGYRY